MSIVDRISRNKKSIALTVVFVILSAAVVIALILALDKPSHDGSTIVLNESGQLSVGDIDSENVNADSKLEVNSLDLKSTIAWASNATESLRTDGKITSIEYEDSDGSLTFKVADSDILKLEEGILTLSGVSKLDSLELTTPLSMSNIADIPGSKIIGEVVSTVNASGITGTLTNDIEATNATINSLTLNNPVVFGTDNFIAGSSTAGTSLLPGGTGTGERNILVGQNTGSAITTGFRNLCMLDDAGRNITEGYDNTCVGRRAGISITSGNNNIIFGANAVPLLTTGNFNIMLGFLVGENIVTGSNNICIGKYTATNLTGSNNICIGGSSGQDITTSDYTVAVGSAALSSLTTGIGNVAFGCSSLGSLITGSYSTAAGYESGYRSSTGDSNTSVGYQSGLTEGSDNSSFGVRSGLTHGSKNSYFGMFSGAPVSSLSDTIDFIPSAQTGSNNVYAGYASGSAIPEGSDNVIMGCLAGSNSFSTNIDKSVLIGKSVGRTFPSSSLLTDTEMIGIGYEAEVCWRGDTIIGAYAKSSDGYANTILGYKSQTQGRFSIIIGTYNDTSTFRNVTIISSQDDDVGITATADNQFFINPSTAGVTSSTLHFNPSTGQVGPTTSSIRFKNNVVDLQTNTDMIMKMRPVTYNRIDTPNYTEDGFIAEEVYDILPSIVPLDKENIPFSVDYSKLSVYIVAYLKEHKFEERIAALEEENKALRKLVME